MVKDYLIISNNENVGEEKDYLNTIKKNKTKNRKRISLKEKIINKYIIEKLSLIKCLTIFLLAFVCIIIFTSTISKLNNKYYKKLINIININNNYNINITINNKTNISDIKNDNISDIKNNNNSDIKNNNISDNNNINNISNNNNENEFSSDKSDISKNEENIQNTDTNISFEESKSQINENLYKEYNFPPLQESFNNAKDFLDKCSKGILINNKKEFKLFSNPKVTAIIPVYNSQNFINRAIKSIQNQNLLDIEIILVNDFSTDNSLKVIEEIKKEDERIKIINNKKNMGILYSRSIGALSSKGKYIFSLDNDDMFLDFDVFSTITKIADEGNIDIVEFKGAMSRYASNIINTHVQDIWFTQNKNFVLIQPELSDYSIKKGNSYDKYELTTVFMWCKCVKGNIYKKALNKIGEEKYSRFMLAHEDCVASFILLNTAFSYKYVGKYGIYNIVRGGSAIYINNNREIINNIKDLYLADVVLDFAKNTTNFKNVIPAMTFFVLNIKILERVVKADKNNEKLLYTYLDRVLSIDFIEDEIKNDILKKVRSLKFLNYSPFKNNIL